MNDLVSVIVPVYNVEEYLSQCIESILNQSYKDLELILIDDGSTDTSDNICDEYKSRDNRVIVVHKENAGVSSARNSGIDLAQGKYITFIDSDDCVAVNYLEKLVELIKDNNVDIAAVQFKNFYNDDELKNYKLKDKKNNNFSGLEAAEICLYQKYGLDGRSCGLLIDSNLCKSIYFPVDFVCAEDLLTVFKYYTNSISVVVSNEQLYYYRQQPNSVMHLNSYKKIIDQMEVCDIIINLCEKNYPQLLPAAHSKKFSNYCNSLLNMDREENRELYKKIKKYLDEVKLQILWDSKCRMKNRVAALMLVFGVKVLTLTNTMITKMILVKK